MQVTCKCLLLKNVDKSTGLKKKKKKHYILKGVFFSCYWTFAVGFIWTPESYLSKLKKYTPNHCYLQGLMTSRTTECGNVILMFWYRTSKNVILSWCHLLCKNDPEQKQSNPLDLVGNSLVFSYLYLFRDALISQIVF